MKLDHFGIEVLDLFTVELFYRTALVSLRGIAT